MNPIFFTIKISFFRKASWVFSKTLTALVKMKFTVDINVYYTCFKTGLYFQLIRFIPFPLLSNVVYKFSCSLDANISYIDMTTRHFGTRIWNICTTKSELRDHIEICQNCKLNNTEMNSFKVLRIYNSECASKIQYKKLIKKAHTPQLNRQLYANSSPFLLNFIQLAFLKVTHLLVVFKLLTCNILLLRGPEEWSKTFSV